MFDYDILVALRGDGGPFANVYQHVPYCFVVGSTTTKC